MKILTRRKQNKIAELCGKMYWHTLHAAADPDAFLFEVLDALCELSIETLGLDCSMTVPEYADKMEEQYAKGNDDKH